MNRSLAALVFVLFAIAGAPADAAEIGAVRQAVNKVYGATITRSLIPGAAVQGTQPLSTGTESGAEVRFADGTILYVGEEARLGFDGLAVDAKTKRLRGTIALSQGLVRIVTSAKPDLIIATKHADLHIRSGAVDLLATPAASEVAVREGSVSVGTIEIKTGEVFRLTSVVSPEPQAHLSFEMTARIRAMVALLDAPPASPAATELRAETAAQFAALDSAPAFQAAIEGKPRTNLLYLDTTAGRIAIELRPDLAPRAVARVRDLVRAEFYDGLTFHHVVPGFVAETGDPTGTGRGGTGTRIEAEPTTLSFERGIVGLKRTRTDPERVDSQFFIVLGPARHLDGDHTAFGRVIFGMDAADKLRPGSPPAVPDRILAARIAADANGGTVAVPCRESGRRLGSC